MSITAQQRCVKSSSRNLPSVTEPLPLQTRSIFFRGMPSAKDNDPKIKSVDKILVKSIELRGHGLGVLQILQRRNAAPRCIVTAQAVVLL